MSLYLGDFAEDATVDFKWSTNDTAGASITRGTNGTVSVYVGNSATQLTTGVTDSEDFDSLTGIHHCRIDLSASATYAPGSECQVVLSAAAIDGETVNAVIAHFSIERSGGALALLKSGTFGLSAIKTQTAAIEADTQDLQTQVGTDGAGLTAIPWNAAWDAEVQSECTDALNAYDPPTNAEMEARTLASASYATATALQTVDDEVGAIDTVVDAIKVTTDKLDDTLEDNSGTYRFTEAALAQAPTGSGGGSGATAQEVWEYATRTLTAIDEDSTTLDIDAAVRAAVGLSSANLDTQLSAIDTVVDRIEVDTQDLQAQVGTDGAGLTAIPWNSAWDAEVQSECADALNAYDPPTNAEMVARTLAAANYATATALQTVDDEIATIDGNVDAIKVKTDSLTFTNSGVVDANITHVISDPVQASSTKETNWGGTEA